MARPKEKRPLIENERFLSRCAKEEEKLRLALSSQLKKDMIRLYEDGLHSDLTLKSGLQEIQLHKFLLKSRTRCLQVYHRLQEVCTEGDGDVLVLPEWIDVPELRKDLRLLYSTLTIGAFQGSHDVGIIQDILQHLTFHGTSSKEEPDSEDCNDDKDGVVADDKEIKLASVNIPMNNLVQNESVEGLENHVEKEEFSVEQSLGENACKTTVHSSKNDDDDGIIEVDVGEEVDVKQNYINGHAESESFIMSIGNENDCKSKVDDVVVDRTDRKSDDQINGTNVNDDKEPTDNTTSPKLMKTPDPLPHKACDSLGEDLLRGYLKELDYDCIISVSGTHFKAHKCILSARCDYFSAMLGGSWQESDAQEICLEGVTPPAMEQVLLYIYGGVLDMEPCCPIGELIMVADMYGLQGLNSIVTYNLRKTYCHFFHKPCSGCESGVVETLTSTVTFNLPELRDKCIDWINTNMVKVWRTKAFATLPPDVLDLCCNTAIQNLSITCVMEVMLDCQKLNRNIPRLKWCEPVLSAVTRLMDSSIEYTGKNFVRLLNSGKLRDIDQSLAYQMGLLEEIFQTVIKSLPISGACQVFQRLHALKEESLSEDIQFLWSEEFCQFIQSLYRMCEEFMKLHIHQMAHTKDWDLLRKDLQSYLMKSSSFVVIDMTAKQKVPPRLARMQKKVPVEVKKEEKNIVKARPILTSDKTRKVAGSRKTGETSSVEKGKLLSLCQGKTASGPRTKKPESSQDRGKKMSGQRETSSAAAGTQTSGPRTSSSRGGNSKNSGSKHCEKENLKAFKDEGRKEVDSTSLDVDGECYPGHSFFFNSNDEEIVTGEGDEELITGEGGEGIITGVDNAYHSDVGRAGCGLGVSHGNSDSGSSHSLCDLPEPLVFSYDLIPVFEVNFFIETNY